MADALEDFLITENSAEFDSAKFRDVTPFKAYLNGEDAGTDETKFFARTIDDVFLNLRFDADDRFAKSDEIARLLANNPRGPLPVPRKRVLEILTAANKSPPARLISHIARHEFPRFECVFGALRNVLRREHAMQNIGNVQQMDARGLRWLAHQPGVTPAQKAGSRQQVLAVVRRKTFDTLENRVLKDFSRRAAAEAIRYLKDFEEKFKNDDAVKKVARLEKFLLRELREEVWSGIKTLRGMPTPNYVLQSDPAYGAVWRLYRKIIERTRLEELAWRRRPMIFAELMRLWISAQMELKCGNDFSRAFSGHLWIDAIPRERGFLDKPNFSNVFLRGNDVLEWRDEFPQACRFFKNGKFLSEIKFVYLPRERAATKIRGDEKTHYVVYIADGNPALPQCADCRIHKVRAFEDVDVVSEIISKTLLN